VAEEADEVAEDVNGEVRIATPSPDTALSDVGGFWLLRLPAGSTSDGANRLGATFGGTNDKMLLHV